MQPTNLYSGDIIPSLEFQPECIALNSLYRAVEETNLWLSHPGNRWMLRGKAKQLRETCETVLKQRGALLAELDRMAKAAPGTRVYFVARAAYFYFSPASSIPRQEMEQYAAAWKTFRQSQQRILAEYDPLKPQTTAQMDEKILANGIPGDPVVNWVWSQK